MTDDLGDMRITVIGAGGTGCALLPLLAVLRPAFLRVVDGDTVEEHNLPRQPLYGPGDVGTLKARTAISRIAHLSPGTTLEAVPRFIAPGNARELLGQSHVVADCTDDLHARTLLDRTCGMLGIPLVTGAVHGHQVQVATLHARSHKDARGLSLKDWFPKGIGAGQDGCDMREVPAEVTTLAAAHMALRIRALLAGDKEGGAVLDLIDVRNGPWMRIQAPEASF